MYNNRIHSSMYECVLPYSRKIWRGIKFGGLAVDVTTAKLKSAKISYSHIIRMAILYRTAKSKSANILAIVILGSTAKFNSHQYFRLYGILLRIYLQYTRSLRVGCILLPIITKQFRNYKKAAYATIEKKC